MIVGHDLGELDFKILPEPNRRLVIQRATERLRSRLAMAGGVGKLEGWAITAVNEVVKELYNGTIPRSWIGSWDQALVLAEVRKQAQHEYRYATDLSYQQAIKRGEQPDPKPKPTWDWNRGAPSGMALPPPVVETPPPPPKKKKKKATPWYKRPLILGGLAAAAIGGVVLWKRRKRR